jgi:chromosomal replication initiation ATPase DnaA
MKTVSQVLFAVWGVTGITPTQMQIKTRQEEIREARQLAMHFAKKYTPLSMRAIGEICGKKDHSTVWHADRRINTLKDSDKKIKAQYELIDDDINGRYRVTEYRSEIMTMCVCCVQI